MSNIIDLTSHWRTQLIRRETGQGKSVKIVTAPISANVVTIVRYHPGWRGRIAYDEFAETIVKLKEPPWNPIDYNPYASSAVREWSDIDTDIAVNWFEREEKLTLSAATVEAGIRVAANIEKIHPVRDYLKSLKWDGTPRLASGLATYFGAVQSEYASAVFPRWMVSAVARVMVPGCQADLVLLLEGLQGTRKSTALSMLVPVPSWYQQTGINIESKDSFSQLRSVWIYGLDELASLRRGDRERWKSFLTSTRDRYRPPYAKREKEFLRQNVFGGTTNMEIYFDDPTGNRRYLPSKVEREADVDSIVRDRDQLWGEAFHLYKSGHVWHIDSQELRLLCEAEQEDRTEIEPWEPVISEWLHRPVIKEEGKHAVPYNDANGVLTHDVLRYALGIKACDLDKRAEMRATNVLRKLGYVRGERKYEPGIGQVRRFTKL